VKLMHDAGVKINYCHCSDPEKLEPLLKLGVDFVLTDRLDLIQAKYKEIRK
jgi:glycerophosphoryl diester phosphodiesterase